MVEKQLSSQIFNVYGFIYRHPKYRIKDPRKSLPFYTGVLGMTLLEQVAFQHIRFSLYIIGYENDDKERNRWAMGMKPKMKLTRNWGTENDDSSCHNGNSDPRGFGHIGIMVPDVDAACARFEQLELNFSVRSQDGKMRGIAFIQDPDGLFIYSYSRGCLLG